MSPTWSKQTIEYQIQRFLEFWKTAGLGYEFVDAEKNENAAHIGDKLRPMLERLENEGVTDKERKEREMDEMMTFIEYFVISRLKFRSLQDCVNYLQKLTGIKREEMISILVNICHLYHSHGKLDLPESIVDFRKNIEALADGRKPPT